MVWEKVKNLNRDHSGLLIRARGQNDTPNKRNHWSSLEKLHNMTRIFKNPLAFRSSIRIHGCGIEGKQLQQSKGDNRRLGLGWNKESYLGHILESKIQGLLATVLSWMLSQIFVW